MQFQKVMWIICNSFLQKRVCRVDRLFLIQRSGLGSNGAKGGVFESKDQNNLLEQKKKSIGGRRLFHNNFVCLSTQNIPVSTQMSHSTHPSGTTVAFLSHLHIAVPALGWLKQLGKEWLSPLETESSFGPRGRQAGRQRTSDAQVFPVFLLIVFLTHAPYWVYWRGRSLRPSGETPCSRWCCTWRTCGGAAPWRNKTQQQAQTPCCYVNVLTACQAVTL